MKISVGNKPYEYLGSLEDRYRIASEMGFTAIDLQLEEWSVGQIKKGEAFGFFDRSTEELIEHFSAYRDAAKKHGMEIYQMHAPFPSAVIENTEMNAYIQTVFQKCIRIAAAMECKFLVVHPLHVGDYTDEEQDLQANIALFSAYIESLKRYRVVMCIENAYYYYNKRITASSESDSAFLVRLVQALNALAGEECFGICYDSGHANITGKNHYKELLTYGSHLKVLHLHDTDGVHDSHLIPYTGRYITRQATDWEGILMALGKIGYNGCINFECESAVTAFPELARADALRLLASIGKSFVKKIEGYQKTVDYVE